MISSRLGWGGIGPGSFYNDAAPDGAVAKLTFRTSLAAKTSINEGRNSYTDKGGHFPVENPFGGIRTNVIIVCPKAGIWWQIFERLRDAGIAAGHADDTPPFPLILAGWIYSSDRDKQERWLALVRWAEKHSLSHFIPALGPDDLYCTDYLSTSYPEQHYRPDRYARRDRPSTDALDTAMSILRRDWDSIAGVGLSAVCEPTRFTGRKARRFLVTVTQEHQPPWGSWHALSSGPERKTFTEFRHRINQAVAPVHFDHIDFCLRVTHTA